MRSGCDLTVPVASRAPHVLVDGLTMAYGGRTIMRDLSFVIRRGDVFVIMGGSGSGKSTLLRHLVGLQQPATGRIMLGPADLWRAGAAEQQALLRRIGVMYQQGALWTSMTLAENVTLPLATYTELAPDTLREIADFKLALVGLAGFGDYYPSEISGGMRKRAAIARAMALDPEILFLDEPSAGLDPVSSRLLDDLILELRDSLGMTVVIVTHELASIFAIADNSVFLDVATRTMIADGNPRWLLEHSTNPSVRAFLTRGEQEQAG